MLPLLNPSHADLFYQAIMMITAAVAVVFTSLGTWLRT